MLSGWIGTGRRGRCFRESNLESAHRIYSFSFWGLVMERKVGARKGNVKDRTLQETRRWVEKKCKAAARGRRKNEIPCFLCDQNVQVSRISSHLRHVHEIEKAPCQICGAWVTLVELSKHYNKCSQKRDIFKKERRAIAPLRNFGDGKSRLWVICYICNRRVRYPMLGRHFSENHAEVKFDKGKTECPICGEQESRRRILTHLRDIHGIKGRLEILSSLLIGLQLKESFFCHVCGRIVKATDWPQHGLEHKIPNELIKPEAPDPHKEIGNSQYNPYADLNE